MPRLCTSCTRGSIAHGANVALDKSASSASLSFPTLVEQIGCRDRRHRNPEPLATEDIRAGFMPGGAPRRQLNGGPGLGCTMKHHRRRKLKCRFLMMSIAPRYRRSGKEHHRRFFIQLYRRFPWGFRGHHDYSSRDSRVLAACRFTTRVQHEKKMRQFARADARSMARQPSRARCL